MALHTGRDMKVVERRRFKEFSAPVTEGIVRTGCKSFEPASHSESVARDRAGSFQQKTSGPIQLIYN